MSLCLCECVSCRITAPHSLPLPEPRRLWAESLKTPECTNAAFVQRVTIRAAPRFIQNLWPFLIMQIIPETPMNAVFIIQQCQIHTHTLTKSLKIALTAVYLCAWGKSCDCSLEWIFYVTIFHKACDFSKNGAELHADLCEMMSA